ncbi:MAG: hypothetical protein ABEJ56_05630 [Candidatus Nanohaloarchaea archaeon]
MTELQLEDKPEEFREWIKDQDLGSAEKTIWNFQKWMREETVLQSGTIVDYRKYVAEMIDESGELTVSEGDLDSSHKRAAFNKFCDYKREMDGDNR